MNLALAMTLALTTAPASEPEPVSAPRSSVTTEDRQIVARAGLLGLLRELDGEATRLVFSGGAVDAALEALSSALEPAQWVESEGSRTRSLAWVSCSPVELGAIFDRRGEDDFRGFDLGGGSAFAWNER